MLGETKVNATELGSVLKVSKQYVGQLAKRGIIQRESDGTYLLSDAVEAYYKNRYMREVEDAELNYGTEKALLTRANRQKAEMEVKVMEGTLHKAEDVARVMTQMLGTFRNRCLNIPAKVAPRLINLHEIGPIQEIVRKEVYEVLTELSEYDPTKFIPTED